MGGEILCSCGLVFILGFVREKRSEPLFKLGCNVDYKGWPNVVVERGVDDLERAVRVAGDIELLESGEEACFVAEGGRGGVVWMAGLPIGKNDHPRACFSYDTRDLEAIFPGVFDASVGDVEGMTILDLENSGGFRGFAGPVFGVASRAHFTTSQVQNSGLTALLCGFEQSPAAGLLNVITMGGDGEDVEGFGHIDIEFLEQAR